MLVDNWRRVIALSLSFWMQVLGLLVLIVPELWFYCTGQDYDPHLAWTVGVGLNVAGLVGRLWQQGVSLWVEWLRIVAVAVIVVALSFLVAYQASAAPLNASPASEGETLDMAVPFILEREGIRLTAYLDIVGVPTICGGITSATGIKVYIGMPPMTMAECRALMRVQIARYRKDLHTYFTAATVFSRLPATRDTAYVSLAYNVGTGTTGKSTAVRRLNAGDIAGGCEALTWFDKAGNRVVRGLFERRKAEKQLCLVGL